MMCGREYMGYGMGGLSWKKVELVASPAIRKYWMGGLMTACFCFC